MTLNTRKIRSLLDDLLAEAREAMAAVDKSRPGTEKWHKNYNRYTVRSGSIVRLPIWYSRKMEKVTETTPRRGRPPKHATEEERHEARKASKRKWAKNRTPEQREKARQATADWRARKAAES